MEGWQWLGGGWEDYRLFMKTTDLGSPVRIAADPAEEVSSALILGLSGEYPFLVEAMRCGRIRGGEIVWAEAHLS
jgi:hypothetical protein